MNAEPEAWSRPRITSGIALAVAGLLSVAPLAAQTPGAAETKTVTVEELIARNIEARGGLEKIKAIRSMRMTGTISIGNTRMPSVLEIKRPDKTRLEFTLEGQKAVQAYDGSTPWVVIPFAGKPEPEVASADDARDLEVQADMDGPLVDYRAKGNRVELLGLGKVRDRDAWRLEVTLANGDVRDLYLDAKTYLPFLTVTERTIGGRSVEIESSIGDYREIGGVLLPYSFETSAGGLTQKQSVRFDKIELNVAIDDARFVMPASSPRPQTPAPPPVKPR
jgi:outer membrane lipoprotein-sorting protein